MSDPSPPSIKQYFSLTLDEIDEIQSKRGEYILYYVGYCMINGVALITRDPENIISPLALGIFAIAVFIFWRFVSRYSRVLRLMTYPGWMWIMACIVSVTPLPGILVVVAADRTISKSLTKALETHD